MLILKKVEVSSREGIPLIITGDVNRQESPIFALRMTSCFSVVGLYVVWDYSIKLYKSSSRFRASSQIMGRAVSLWQGKIRNTWKR